MAPLYSSLLESLLPGAAGAQQAASHKSWTDILTVFDMLLGIVKANYVPKVLVQVRAI